MKRRESNGLFFLIGMAAGIGAGFYLNSREGKAFRKRASETITDYKDQVVEGASKGYHAIGEGFNQVVEKGKEFSSSVSESVHNLVQNTANKAEDVIDDSTTAYEKGAEKAKKTIKENAKAIDKKLANA